MLVYYPYYPLVDARRYTRKTRARTVIVVDVVQVSREHRFIRVYRVVFSQHVRFLRDRVMKSENSPKHAATGVPLMSNCSYVGLLQQVS